jgi:hypothetical protein
MLSSVAGVLSARAARLSKISGKNNIKLRMLAFSVLTPSGYGVARGKNHVLHCGGNRQPPQADLSACRRGD